MIGTAMRFACGGAALAMLAACGNMSSQDSVAAKLVQAARQTVDSRKADAAPAEARDPGQMAATALRVNPGPLIMVGLESQGSTQVMAMTGENAGQRTYMTPNEQALVLRGGMLVGTRGLGHDLSVAESAQSAALIRASRSGQASRTMRYWTGDGLERPMTLSCSISPGPKAGVMLESCQNGPLNFQNNYLVQGGRITVSRQWIGPNLGYVTIQELRP
ncbi:YjbF family lipoprotein [Paracoccus sp. DK608]|uniref:YjbF family lipoprotein n=2 Tax=Paracoccus shanxieyensis TaxID=2675752 RepID=A0A6L6J1F0_9RHOB|nr:YjbF family lipoprotein [Paracoccus shanxieyensis]MTH87758.1 YjbF family lipoprotein [Paracoccus shanxieyensis]